jgi:LuxR family transcriptional regulator, maltose regulon positive regulatory protein
MRAASPPALPLKCRRPARRNGLAERERLVGRLVGARDAPLALLVAPAGYGKTTILAQWAEREKRPFAWLTLDEEDDAPDRLLASIASALGVVDGGPGPPRHSGRSLPRLLEWLESRDAPFVLALDNAEVLSGSGSLDVLGAIVDHVPWGSQLAIASRREPAMHVGRLRAHRKVVELRHGDLVMTPSEAGALLAGTGLDLERTEVEVLVRRTGGWAAGLYLAALSIRKAPDPGLVIAAFSGDNTLVADYLQDEFLSGLSRERAAFLRDASVVEVLSGPACDAILGRSGSARVLAGLARSNLLLFPVGGADAYLLHPLLVDLLRAELRRSEPERALRLHKRAAVWHAEHRDVDRAIGHAIAARDARLAGDLLWPNILSYVGYGQNAMIQEWLDRFAPAEIGESPALALVAAISWFTKGDGILAEHWTAAAARGVKRVDDTDMARSLAAGVAVMRSALAADGLGRMRDDAARADGLLPDDGPWRAVCRLLTGVADHLTGDRHAARVALEEGARRGAVAAPSIQALCLAQLALLALDEGEWSAGEMHAARARAQVERFRLSGYPGSALVLAVSAVFYAGDGRVDEAKMDASRAADLIGRLTDVVPWYEAEVRVALARVALRLGDLPAARTLLEEATRLSRGTPEAVVLAEWLEVAWGRVDSAPDQVVGAGWALTTAELRVLLFLPTHLSFPEVASQLNVSANTIKTHARAVYRKLGASSRAEAVVCAREAGLIGPDSFAMPKAA